MSFITGWRNLKTRVKTTLGTRRDPSLITPDTLQRRLPPNGAVTGFTSPAPGYDPMPARLMGRAEAK